MIINLFDSNFSHDNFSTAYQSSKYIQYVKQQLNFDGVTLFTDEWINNEIVDRVQSRYKVGWLHEPYCLHPDTYHNALVNRDKFDFILTYQATPNLWEFDSKFIFCPYAGNWIDKADWGIKPKSKLCSMLIGSKMATEGHRIRHEIAEMIDEAGFDVDFYGTKGTPTEYGQSAKLTSLSDYCFSIVTETCREDNLFTEWLLDCFALGTIPIFWGASNIYRYFDYEGIIQFDTVDRLYKILAGLDWSKYHKRLSNAYENLGRVKDYAITEDWIYQNVLKELEQ